LLAGRGALIVFTAISQRGTHMAQLLRSSFSWIQVLILGLLLASSGISAQGRDRTPPTAPTNLTVVTTTEHSVTLSWTPSTDNSGKFTYIIQTSGVTATATQAMTSFTVEGLQSGKTYVFRVYARDFAGNLSKSSNAVTVTLPGEIAAPTKPVVTVQEVGPTHVKLAWLSTDNGPAIWYTVYIDGEQVSTLNQLSGTFTCARVMVPTYCEPINQETTYTFTVRARDTDGNLSPMSDPVFVTTLPANPDDHTPPTSPANVTAENTGGFHMVRWDASTDDFAAQQFIRYDLYVNDQLQTVVVGVTSGEVELYLNETSTITVIAVDTADNESPPASIVVVN
jgi:chitodextrinase